MERSNKLPRDSSTLTYMTFALTTGHCVWHKELKVTQLPHVQKVVVAHQIVIKDRSGKVRMQIGCDSDDNPRIEMLDTHGRPRFTAFLADDLAGVKLVSNQGQPQIELCARNECDTAYLHINNEAGNNRLIIGYEKDVGQVQIVAATEYPQVILGTQPAHGSTLILCGANGTPSTIMNVPDGSNGHLSLAGAEGAILTMRCAPDGSLEMAGGAMRRPGQPNDRGSRNARNGDREKQCGRSKPSRTR